jgi:hypothetical protein
MFKAITPREARYPAIDVASTSEFILSVQKKDGEIPWSKGGKTDPWDHVESAMGLAIGGYYREAKKAYLWSYRTQLPDGSWWSEYKDGNPRNDAYKDSNMTAYIAVGVLHYYLVTGDYKFVRHMWATVSNAIDYVIRLQASGGEILWAKRADGSIDRKALLTGSSSIYISLTCALKIASLLEEERPHWEIARMRLGDAIRNRPQLFDQSKSKYSMDWYYPVLCGILRGKEAENRIQKSWNNFAIPAWGIRCVSDQPWVTMAETSELVVALAAIGNFETAEMVLSWIQDKRYEDGSFWTGVTVPDNEIYTTEKTAWTAAAVLLAADILYGISPASQFFSHSFWKSHPFDLLGKKVKGIS